MKKLGSAFLFISISIFSFSQFQGGRKNGAGRMGGQMNIGHFYGKIIDSKTGKGIEGVTIQLKGNK